jgi:hypothetical protein
MTILSYFHSSYYRMCRHYHTEYVVASLRPYVSTLVSYTHFVESLLRVLVTLCCYL